MLRSLFRLQHKTSETSARMRCFTLVQGATPAPTAALHLGLHVCSLFFHELVLSVWVKSFGPGESNSRGIQDCIFYQYNCQQGLTSEVFLQIQTTPPLEGCFIGIQLEWQPVGSSGSSFNPRVCSPSMLSLLTSLCLLKNFIMPNKHQSEEQWNRLWRPWTTLDHRFHPEWLQSRMLCRKK